MSPDVPLLEMRGITMDFPGVRALDGVDLDVYGGEFHAIVGENGAGKSTLIRILGGAYPHGSFGGSIRLRERPVRFHSVRDAESAGISVIHQEPALVPELTVAENMFLGDEPCRFGCVDWAAIFARAQAVADALDLPLDVGADVASLGMAARQLVDIAKALRKQPPVLVLDEPTSALAEHEAETLFSILSGLKARGTAIVYITHKLDEVFRMADRVTVLRDGRPAGSGPIAQWQRATLVRAMVDRELTDMYPRAEREPGPEVLRVEDLCVRAPGTEGRMILRDVSFAVQAGEVLGVAGLMGAGRTALLSTLFGDPPGAVSGCIAIHGRPARIGSPRDAIRLGLALVPEDRQRQGLVPPASLVDNLTLAHLREFCRGGIVDAAARAHRAGDIAADVDVRAASLDVPARSLSGGNQQKVVLGKWLVKAPCVLLLDEPTRGIDVGAKVEVFRLMSRLAAQGMAIVMVSSELPEVLGVSDRVIVLREGCVAGRFARGEATQEAVMALAV